MKNSLTLSSRILSGAVVFVGAGLLINSIMSGHGGTDESQSNWREAQARSIALTASKREALASLDQPTDNFGIDQTITGAIATSEPVSNSDNASAPQAQSEPSVLSLIRKNSDLNPGVSSGTDRVSVIVKTGDTLFGIALRHGLKTNELARLNGLKEPYVIKAGQSLYVAR
jgi:LysM repeat protein